MKQQALTVAGIIFALIALLHLSRLYFAYPITIGETIIPLWGNVIGLIVFSALSFWMFYSLREKN